MTILLVTGGARSGKSRFAETRTLQSVGSPFYIATAAAGDREMAERITRHQASRSGRWITVEEPLELARVLAETDGRGARLVDCLTLWLTNHMLAGNDPDTIGAELVDYLRRARSDVTLVTNEVGSGIVPDNALARRFQDAQGRINQAVAEVADEVVLMVSGLPLQIKPSR